MFLKLFKNLLISLGALTLLNSITDRIREQAIEDYKKETENNE